MAMSTPSALTPWDVQPGRDESIDPMVDQRIEDLWLCYSSPSGSMLSMMRRI